MVIEKTEIGKRTKTDVAIIFIEDIADPNMVQEIRNRLNKVDIDGISSMGELEQLIEDNNFIGFPAVYEHGTS